MDDITRLIALAFISVTAVACSEQYPSKANRDSHPVDNYSNPSDLDYSNSFYRYYADPSYVGDVPNTHDHARGHSMSTVQP